MKIFKTLLGILYHAFFGVYKDHTVVEISHDNYELSTVLIKSVDGVSITFYCKKFNYVVENHSKWVPNYRFYNYEISGDCGDRCTTKLRSVLKRVVYFPPLGTFFVSEHNRRKFLIEAYIDLLNSDLEKLKT